MTEKRILAMGSDCPFLTQLFSTFQTPVSDILYSVLELYGLGDGGRCTIEIWEVTCIIMR